MAAETPYGSTPRRPGRPTMLDVAEAAGVSRALVSIVFRGAPGASPENRAKVLAAADRLGFSPNRSASMLKLRRNRHLGVTMDLRSTFHAELVESVQTAAEAAGYEVVLSATSPGRPEALAVSTLLDFRCEALLLLGTSLDEQALSNLARQVRVVLIGGARASEALHVVRSSDERGQQLLVDHLYARGHRRLAYVDGGRSVSSTERRHAFRHALRQRNDVEAVMVAGGVDESSGERAAAQLLDSPELPTAVCAYNDHVAIGLMERFSRAGVRVPDEVSITGYDDTATARLLAFDLTSVNQDAPAQAVGAVGAAVRWLEGDREGPREQVFEPRLVVRGSVSTPRSAQP